MNHVRPARNLTSAAISIGIALVLLFVLSRVQRVAQDWLMQVFGQMSPWILWTLVIVVPSIPIIYTLIVWWRSRHSSPSSRSKEDA